MVQLIHLPLNKMAAILQTVFSDTILLMKSFVFWLMFVLKGPIDNKQALVGEMSWWLVAVRQQAIAWANIDQDLSCQMESLGHNVFIGMFTQNYFCCLWNRLRLNQVLYISIFHWHRLYVTMYAQGPHMLRNEITFQNTSTFLFSSIWLAIRHWSGVLETTNKIKYTTLENYM